MTAARQRTFVDDIFEHAEQNPDAPAVLTEQGEISYGALAERIDYLARRLRAHGVGPERVCAVAVSRGVKAVVAMAAVVRAGGAFLALDMESPSARLAAAMSSGGAWCLLADRRSVDTLPAVDGPTVLVYEACRVGSDDGAGETAMGPISPRSLAYVSHTSGSTGTPNPVLIEHGGLQAYLRAVIQDNGLGPDTVTLQLAPIGYDASIRDIFAPLAAGGRLVLVDRSRLMTAQALAETLAAYRVDTVLSTTPSFLTFLSKRPEAAAGLRALRLLASSGESLRPFLAAGGRALIGGRLVNQYGPTECTMTTTRYEVPADDGGSETDPVGTPMAGAEVHLLDRELRTVPAGAVGEVHIGGPGVARGYRGRAARTADRFLPDPYGPPGARMYRTGDLARRRPDGVLEYLGRADRQIKIRGYRVDPAEIEGALLGHPRVTGAVVTAAADADGRTWLTAHLTGSLGDVADTELRAHLADTLPPYMMPRRFTRIERLPVTHSGKADRGALIDLGLGGRMPECAP